jgi:Domain of unknown function (DUF5655)
VTRELANDFGQQATMGGHTCYHCKQWVEEGDPHDCWTTTEAALTSDLDDDLREAWERVRETAADFGDQRIYASHHSIMFSRRSCYFFVRPKRNFLELNVFLGRTVQAPQIRKVIRSSAAKAVHVIQIRHRDEVEAPITEWLEEAYHYAEAGNTKATKGGTKGTKRSTKGTKRSTGTKRSMKGTKGSMNATKKRAAKRTSRTAPKRR